MSTIQCRQLIFWSAKSDFPLDYTAIHIWDKKTGCGSEYERIFERNGSKQYKMFRYYLINSVVAASYGKDVYTGHPSQKPIQLIKRLIVDYSNPGDLIFDPFMGSGTTAVAAIRTGRHYIAVDIDEGCCDIAKKRVSEERRQLRFPELGFWDVANS